ncbi:MAG TPA: hypothetical protein VNC39_05920 [Acidocella sp.]|jgi:hypothetical protein|uniref:hypothetical protein n=1 Tax=Acidocella sp. TaxID=50710 RepID=UPI002B7829C7|nr:hypothetical protein [Acidocella sp.]HVE21495.1 hypothetical protein [Acidocella sp.]
MNLTIKSEATPLTGPVPKFGSIDTWCSLTGMGRRATYAALGHGTPMLINIEKGLA